MNLRPSILSFPSTRLLVLLGASAPFRVPAQSPTRAAPSVLFTAAPSNLATVYIVSVRDTLAPDPPYAILAIGEAGHLAGIEVHKQACLRFDRARLRGDSIIELASSDVANQPMQAVGKVYINVARDSWTWNGAAPSASPAPPC